MTDDYNQIYNEKDLENQYNQGFLAGEQKAREEELEFLKKILEKMVWEKLRIELIEKRINELSKLQNSKGEKE